MGRKKSFHERRDSYEIRGEKVNDKRSLRAIHRGKKQNVGFGGRTDRSEIKRGIKEGG